MRLDSLSTRDMGRYASLTMCFGIWLIHDKEGQVLGVDMVMNKE